MNRPDLSTTPDAILAYIEYLEEMEIYPILGVRRPLRINVQGWRSLFIFTPLILAVVALVGGVWLLFQFWMSQLPIRLILQWTVMIAMIGGMVDPVHVGRDEDGPHEPIDDLGQPDVGMREDRHRCVD